MRVLITQLPQNGEFEEFDLRRFRVGVMYDVTSQLGMLLVLAGYAESVPGLDRAEVSDDFRRPNRDVEKA